MAFAVNDIIQTACEDLNLTDDGEPVSGELAAVSENCLNRAITTLNSDGYISQSVSCIDRVSNGSVLFKKLEAGEAPSSNIVDSEPPDSVGGVSRKVGIRWFRLRPTNPQAMDRQLTFSLPTAWSYGVDKETAPSGKTRNVGVLRLDGSNPVELRIYVNSQLSHYKLGDMIYLSPLYYNLVLYSLEERLVAHYKLKSYEDQVNKDLTGAKKAIDTNTANNRPLDNGLEANGSYLDGYCDLVGGVGF